MTEQKIVLTVEQETALAEFKKWNGDKSKAYGWFIEKGGENLNKYKPLYELTPQQFALVLLDWYEVEQPQFQVGDWATRINANANMKYRKEYENGYTFQIGYVNKGGVCKENESDDFQHVMRNLRHSTPEEIKAAKEREIWAKMGREVGEFKEGDIFIDKNNTCFEVSQRVEEDKIRESSAKKWYANGDMKGLYPAESFISFETKKD